MIATPTPSSGSRPWALAPLLKPSFWGLLAVLLVTLFLSAQRPLDYAVAIGREDGHDSDLPFVFGWNVDEKSEDRLFRWTSDDTHLRLDGLPGTPLNVTLEVLGSAAHPDAATGLLEIATPEQRLATLPMSRRVLHLLTPPVADGHLDLRFQAPLWEPPNDPRLLGVQVGALRIATLSAALMPVPLVWFWPVLLLPLVWLALGWWGPSSWRFALAGAGLICLLLLLLSLADRLRFALGARPALLATGWGLLLAAGMRWLAGRYVRWLTPVPSRLLLNGLVLLFFGLFTLRYAGRLYPASMPGDIGFHVNRENDVIRGTVLLLSRHRDIDFPYPSALYVMLMPLRLLPFSGETLVNFANALFGALGVPAVGYLALLAMDDERVALFAAAIYALLAPGIMSLWWSFLPHTFAQEFFVVLLAALAAGFPALRTRRGMLLAAAGLALLYTSHVGLYINMSLVLGIVLAWQFLRGRRAGAWAERRALLGLAAAFVLAQVVVLVVFYSAYLPLILGKLAAFGQGGMSAVQEGRPAQTMQELLHQVGVLGLGMHYAYLGVPLAALGGYRLWQARPTFVRAVAGATVLVVLVQGILPFATASDVTTRWLSLATFPVALGLALLLDLLWRRWPGRLMAVLVIAWIGGSTLWMWIQALAYRIRPPEPF